MRFLLTQVDNKKGAKTCFLEGLRNKGLQKFPKNWVSYKQSYAKFLKVLHRFISLSSSGAVFQTQFCLGTFSAQGGFFGHLVSGPITADAFGTFGATTRARNKPPTTCSPQQKGPLDEHRGPSHDHLSLGNNPFFHTHVLQRSVLFANQTISPTYFLQPLRGTQTFLFRGGKPPLHNHTNPRPCSSAERELLSCGGLTNGPLVCVAEGATLHQRTHRGTNNPCK